MSKNYKLLIFDVDGTLFDTSEGIISSVKYALKKNKLSLSHGIDYQRTFIGPPIQNTLKRLFPELAEERIKEVALDFRNHYKDVDLCKATPYPHLYEVLDELDKRGIKIAVATFKREDYAFGIVDHFGITKYTNNIFGQDFEGKRDKADIIELAIKKSGLPKEACLMIGDTSNDGDAAKKAGIDFLEVTFGFGFTKDKHYEGESIGSIDSYPELLNILDNLKKVGILTIFRTGNYGGTLQAYALKEAIKENRFAAPTIINYCCDSIKGKIDRKFLKKAGLKRTIISIIEKIYYHPRMKKVYRFVDSFLDTPELKRSELSSLNNQYDIFLSGSDQIWNPDLQQGDYSYLLDFVSDEKKKRSYASSFGRNDIPEEYKEKYKELLSRYDELTVREETGSKLVKSLINKEPPVVLDPVLLLDKKEWEAKLGKPVYKNKQYIFTYQMSKGPLPANVTKAAKKHFKLKSFYVPFPIGGHCSGKYSLKLSSLEWVRAIYDAKFVVTDSFHAMVFAIIFNKPFYYVVTSNTTKKRLSRVETLLKTLGIEDRIIEKTSNYDFNKVINFEDVNKRLETTRNKSLKILEELCK